MPLRLLRRSLTLWSGVLVIVFTCWAWWDSRGHFTGVKLGAVGISSGAGGVSISHLPRLGLGFSQGREGFRSIPPLIHPPALVPPPFLLRHSGAKLDFDPLSLKERWQTSVNVHGPGGWIFYFPYWLLLACMLPVWGALLHWRWRRMKKHHPHRLADAID